MSSARGDISDPASPPLPGAAEPGTAQRRAVLSTLGLCQLSPPASQWCHRGDVTAGATREDTGTLVWWHLQPSEPWLGTVSPAGWQVRGGFPKGGVCGSRDLRSSLHLLGGLHASEESPPGPHLGLGTLFQLSPARALPQPLSSCSCHHGHSPRPLPVGCWGPIFG